MSTARTVAISFNAAAQNMTAAAWFRFLNFKLSPTVMQNKYVGDIGDYVKLAILRTLSPGYQLGVAWWLVNDEHDSKKDGRHISYLSKPEHWRCFDPELFDSLKQIVDRNDRSVAALENATLLPGCSFASKLLPLPALLTERIPARKRWISETAAVLNHTNFLFLDPDNGLEPDRFRPRSKGSVKSVSFDDLNGLASDKRTLIIYHHQTRQKGGHFAEIEYQVKRLRRHGYRSVDVIRAKPYSPRAFFILDGNDMIRQRAANLVTRWDGHLSWHPDMAR